MPLWIEPGSDEARLTFLKRAVTTAEQDIASGNTYVSQETVDGAKAFIPEFENKYLALSQKLSDRSKEAREGTAAIEKLQVYVRDLWEVLKRRVYRLEQPAEVFSFYALPLSGIIPKPAAREEWLTLAESIIDGDAKAVTAGYAAMQNPAVSEIATVLQETRAELDDVAGADRAYDMAQEELAALRPEAREHIHAIMDELRFYLRKKDDASQRRIMRTYGAMFRYLEGEPVGDETV